MDYDQSMEIIQKSQPSARSFKEKSKISQAGTEMAILIQNLKTLKHKTIL